MEKETFISKDNIKGMLASGSGESRKLWQKASMIRDRHVGRKVYFRGLIEFSNICDNDCFYCGLRKSNHSLKRYSMNQEEILECARMSHEAGYASIVLQSGQRQGKEFVDFVSSTLRRIKKNFPTLGITLCVGEQEKQAYRKFYEAGAHRYLLRIESSHAGHYSRLHPQQMSYGKRQKCLKNLKDIGFQVGTGVMIGSPFQSIDNLSSDLLFMKKLDIDMVGMGPYVPHDNTPLDVEDYNKTIVLERSLNMVSLLRIMMPDINIAATTALQALDPCGREKGLAAGANIIMPAVTPQKYRSSYLLYTDRPCIDESARQCRSCIFQRVKSTGLSPGTGEWGDSPRYFKRRKKEEDVRAG